MKVVIQRVNKSSVEINNKIKSEIQKGLSNGKINLKPLISKTFDFEQSITAFHNIVHN